MISAVPLTALFCFVWLPNETRRDASCSVSPPANYRPSSVLSCLTSLSTFSSHESQKQCSWSYVSPNRVFARKSLPRLRFRSSAESCVRNLVLRRPPSLAGCRRGMQNLQLLVLATNQEMTRMWIWGTRQSLRCVFDSKRGRFS